MCPPPNEVEARERLTETQGHTNQSLPTRSEYIFTQWDDPHAKLLYTASLMTMLVQINKAKFRTQNKASDIC